MSVPVTYGGRKVGEARMGDVTSNGTLPVDVKITGFSLANDTASLCRDIASLGRELNEAFGSLVGLHETMLDFEASIQLGGEGSGFVFEPAETRFSGTLDEYVADREEDEEEGGTYALPGHQIKGIGGSNESLTGTIRFGNDSHINWRNDTGTGLTQIRTKLDHPIYVAHEPSEPFEGTLEDYLESR